MQQILMNYWTSNTENREQKKRDEFEVKAKAFIVGEMIKEARKKAHLTQDDLAKKTGTKKKVIYPDLKMEKLTFKFLPCLKFSRKD